MPVTRYQYHGFIDAGEQLSTDEPAHCEKCGKTPIRWVHQISRPGDDNLIEVGCCCAERLCPEVDVRSKEKEFRNRLNRLQSFVASTKWKPSKSSGNPTRQYLDVPVVITRARTGSYRFGVLVDGEWQSDGRWYPDESAAKIAAFEWFERGGVTAAA